MKEPGEITTVKTTCPYCGVGCGILASQGADGFVSIKGDPDHPANFGRLCSKGAALGETMNLAGRLLYPEVDGARTSWDQALDLVASRFSETIASYGRESVALYISGQLLTEDYYVANKLMKGYIGSANIDTNSRLCMASSVAGHRRAFGADTVPGTYEDLELADLVVLVGSNLAWCHPVLYQRIVAAKAERPEMKIVLIDPRRTMTNDLADMHLAINPDGDVALFQGLLVHLSADGALDWRYIDAHTTGFEEALASAAPLSLTGISEKTGIEINELRDFYRIFSETEKTVTLYSQGVNQSAVGTDKVNAIINCHLATGRIGREGMGPFSVTGQPNAMGGREVGGMANMLACHMDIENAEHRSLVQRFWGSPVMADRTGLKAVNMFQSLREGRIKAIWIMGTNPADSLPEADLVRVALETCPFVVVSDIIQETDTTLYADVKLPSEGWGEKEGLVTNSERRISRQQKFLPTPGEARADWRQLAEVAKRMGFVKAFDFVDAASVAREYAALSAFENNGNRDFDIGALADMAAEDFAKFVPVQWPFKAGESPKKTRFFADGLFYTPNGRARFCAPTETKVAIHSLELPFALNTGRIRDQWHTMTRTGKSPRLSQHLAEPFAEIHPADAAELGIGEAGLVEISNDFGSVTLRAMLTDTVRRKSVFVPMHWTDQFASNARVNSLVPAVTDPISGQPATKNIRCTVHAYAAQLQGFMVIRNKPDVMAADYWALAKCESGWRVEFAGLQSPAKFLDLATELLGGGELIAYQDQTAGEYRYAVFDGEQLNGAVYMSSTPVLVSRTWLVNQLGMAHANRLNRYQLLAGRSGGTEIDIGAIVCSCFSVGRNQILSAITEMGCADLTAIGNCVQAGTNCGSCRSEIAEILNDAIVRQAAE
ncbi:MAG: molybdopterin-dependent oxidoreductase [Sneathiella sp.]|nr:molybdopterin-dependent oxidoreductase [Sneathiella sp.]